MTERNSDNITQAQFNRYRKVQIRGKYNMLMESNKAAQAASLTNDEYFTILQNFGKLKAKFELDSD